MKQKMLVGVCWFLCSTTVYTEPFLPEHHYTYDDFSPSVSSLLHREREIRDKEHGVQIKEVVTDVIQEHDKKHTDQKQSTQSVSTPVIYQKTPTCYGTAAKLDLFYDDERLTNKLVSICFKQVSIRKTLDTISALTGISLLLDADVVGTVRDFCFENLPVGHALRILLGNNNPKLALVADHDVWRVRLYDKACEALLTHQAVRALQEVSCKTIKLCHVTYHEQWKTKVEQLWSQICGKQADHGAFLFFDQQNKQVVVKGPAQAVADFEQCLKAIDIPIPQIRIEARIILASKDFEDSLGFNWTGIYDRCASGSDGYGSVKCQHTTFHGVGIGEQPDEPARDKFSGLLTWGLNLIAPNLAKNPLMNLPFTFANKAFTKRLNLLLNAAEIRQEIRTILKPSLLVNSDDVAEILVGEELPHEVKVQETIEGARMNVSTTNYKDIGTKISVKPQVLPGHGSVMLEVFIENSRLKEPSPFLASSCPPAVMGTTSPPGGAFEACRSSRGVYNYTIETSRSRNRVVLKDGQTTLIGGLVVSSHETAKRGVPYLSKIPLVGWLFRGKRKVALDKQILIFITPTLVA